jgi:hypothetical protein
MTTESSPTSTPAGTAPAAPAHPQERPSLRHMPGIVAISCYMTLLAGIDVYYVVIHRVGPLYLILSALFVASALGLLMLFRWAWALTLAAVALLSALFLRAYFNDKSFDAFMQGVINLVIFLYLVRTELRDRLR